MIGENKDIQNSKVYSSPKFSSVGTLMRIIYMGNITRLGSMRIAYRTTTIYITLEPLETVIPSVSLAISTLFRKEDIQQAGTTVSF
jgi:hypothetical protein